MVGSRTLHSLAQFLALLNTEPLVGLLSKHGLDGSDVQATQFYGTGGLLSALLASVRGGGEFEVISLVGEIVRTSNDLRSQVSPRYRFDERFDDLEQCLRLDGYLISERRVIPVDPTIVGAPPLEDDLTKELNESGLPGAGDVIKKLSDSVEAFRASVPNYDASLNDARIALQTLAGEIANERLPLHPGSFDSTKWGAVIAYLRSTGFITSEEERGLVGVFGFVSPGSHQPLGFSEAEFARLGRSFVLGMCWFLIKRHRNNSSNSS